MIKLKPEMEVVYVHFASGSITLVDKSKVVSIDKEKGTATLSNGIVLNREILKKGYFKRAGVRSDDRGYLYKDGTEGSKIYQAYLCKNRLKLSLPNIKKAIDSKDLIADQGWFIKFNEIIEKYI